IFEAAEIEPIGNEIAHILCGAGEAGSDLSAAADAAESRAEELAEEIQLWPGAFALQAWQLVLLERQRALDALGQLGQETLYVAAFHAANGANSLGIGGLALR